MCYRIPILKISDIEDIKLYVISFLEPRSRAKLRQAYFADYFDIPMYRPLIGMPLDKITPFLEIGEKISLKVCSKRFSKKIKMPNKLLGIVDRLRHLLSEISADLLNPFGLHQFAIIQFHPIPLDFVSLYPSVMMDRNQGYRGHLNNHVLTEGKSVRSSLYHSHQTIGQIMEGQNTGRMNGYGLKLRNPSFYPTRQTVGQVMEGMGRMNGYGLNLKKGEYQKKEKKKKIFKREKRSFIKSSEGKRNMKKYCKNSGR